MNRLRIDASIQLMHLILICNRYSMRIGSHHKHRPGLCVSTLKRCFSPPKASQLNDGKLS